MRVIAGTARSVPLKTLDGLDTRPTTDRVKEAVFNIIQFEIEGRRVLDLFGGSGQMAIEALSRGAAHADIVDCSKLAAGVIKENLQHTKLSDRASVTVSDYMQFLNTAKAEYDLVFLDPPYAEKFLENALNRISEIDILKSGGIIVCEKPSEKNLCVEMPGFTRSKEYRYGKTAIVLFRKNRSFDIETGGIFHE